MNASIVGLIRSVHVISAESGAEALKLLDDDVEFDLLFTGVIMPGRMDGLQLAEAVAARRPAVKVLFTSGYTENAMIHQGRLDAGVLLLQKPHRREEMARTLRRVLDEQAPTQPQSRAAVA